MEEHGMSTAASKLCWYQYTLRTLLTFTTLCAFGCSWLAVKMRQAQREREAGAAIEQAGGMVLWSEPSDPKWLRCLVGDSLFVHVDGADLSGTDISDAGLLEHVCGLAKLNGLGLSNCRKVTDVGIRHICRMRQLHFLNLTDTQATDACVEELDKLDMLEDLDIGGPHLTEAGLEHLTKLHQLRSLRIDKPGVPKELVEKLHKALPSCHIVYPVDI
jgi:hypothetical protein